MCPIVHIIDGEYENQSPGTWSFGMSGVQAGGRPHTKTVKKKEDSRIWQKSLLVFGGRPAVSGRAH